MIRRGAYHVYIVECADRTYYTGSTNNLEARLKLHNSGDGAKYLRGKGPVVVVYKKAYRYYKRALDAERQLKKLTRRQKEELIAVYVQSRPRRFDPARLASPNEAAVSNLTAGAAPPGQPC